MSIGAVVIGRNEGQRLLGCLASLRALSPVVYVDSGSTDGSVAAARAAGAEVVELDMTRPFTAARARNEGVQRLREIAPETAFVQVIDGDCELVDGFVEAARAAMAEDVAVVCGRRRERCPDASRWNRLTDQEWDTPVGEARACGGDALIRAAALEAVGGYRPDLIAGEEPEMCLRLRREGWRILRIDAEMTLHDAQLTRPGQWWQRTRRAGHAFAEGWTLHGRGPERYRARETLRALIWGAGIPALTVVLAGLVSPWALALLLVYPAQILRLGLKGMGWERAIFLTLGKFPEAQGALGHLIGHALGRRRGLIEYK